RRGKHAQVHLRVRAAGTARVSLSFCSHWWCLSLLCEVAPLRSDVILVRVPLAVANGSSFTLSACCSDFHLKCDAMLLFELPEEGLDSFSNGEIFRSSVIPIYGVICFG
ncbi:unnamed protein product, partial [Scytosiphon promiscuus]